MEPHARPDPPQRSAAEAGGDVPEREDAAADGERSIRAARLALIREQVAAGLYDTPDRLDAALDGLLADLHD